MAKNVNLAEKFKTQNLYYEASYEVSSSYYFVHVYGTCKINVYRPVLKKESEMSEMSEESPQFHFRSEP